jgi:NADH-quinone oxidoreductase subunit M
MTLFPAGMGDWGWGAAGLHSWRGLFAALATVGIVYGALVALVQKDFKFVIGYSSVSHMGFVMLGLMTLDGWGLSGAVLQMFSHGIIAGLLFAVVGRMVYDRTHTREFDELEWMRLDRAIPFAATTFAIAAAASMGLPGFSGFVAELQVLLGAWQAFPTLAVVTGAGILVGAAYTLRAMQKAFYGDAARGGRAASGAAGEESRAGAGHGAALEPISVPERLGAVLLIGTTVVVGLYPRVLLDVIFPALGSPLFEGLRKGVGP